MLSHLRLKNFIIVPELEINFSEGLQVITGETGAGKSIIVGAIDIIFGAEIQADIRLEEKQKTILEATFDIQKCKLEIKDLLEKHGVDFKDNELFFTKEIDENLRSKIFLNGRRISIPIAREFREKLIDFHSQRDQQKLFDQEYQLEILDHYGRLIEQRKDFESDLTDFQEKKQKLLNLKREDQENRERIELYNYQLNELENVAFQKKEDEVLKKELELLSNAEVILQKSREIEQRVFEEENSVYDVIGNFVKELEPFAGNDDHLQSALAFLRDALSNLDEAVQELRDLGDFIDVDQERKEKLEQRFDEINKLLQKYRKTIPEILAYQEKIRKEIKSYSSKKDKILQLEKELLNQENSLCKKAVKLSNKRKKAAARFEEEIAENIRKLAIPEAKVKIRFDKESGEKVFLSRDFSLKKSGIDVVDYLFSANRGVKMQPFRMIASGGEVSRFLLTVKKILSDRMQKRTIIFDEIDQGIGGKTSQLLADFIHRIGDFHQIICITHLPQIAAAADDHYSIQKNNVGKNSNVTIKKLDKDKRQNEIARMLAGSKTKRALEHAAELLGKKRSQL